jgi:hypothetical protein
VIYEPPKGECFTCGTTAVFKRGSDGDSGELIWTVWTDSVIAEEAVPWPYGSNGCICPPCAREFKAKRAQREKDFKEKGPSWPQETEAEAGTT